MPVFCLLSWGHTAYAQNNKICFFKYGAIPGGVDNKWRFFAGDTTYITMFDYSNPDELKFVSSYGLASQETTILTRIKDSSFDNEPTEIRGHRLLGAYFNKRIGMYELLYLLPGHASLLTKFFYGPGSLFTYNYASDKKINPFEDLLFPEANDTFQLRSVPPTKRKPAAKE